MIQMAAHAKLNLYLDITGKRDDGYHTLNMLMQSIDLSDIVSIEEQESGISLETTDPCLPTDAQNLAFRAAELFLSAAHLESGIRIHIEKNIPLEAGLGGGSADAAAVLSGCNLLFGCPLGGELLSELALRLGADIPFSLVGGCRRAEGIGEILMVAENHTHPTYLLLRPLEGVGTKEAYDLFDQAPVHALGHLADCRRALAENDLKLLGQSVYNALELPARKLCPGITGLLDYLRSTADAAFMTGSGSTCVGMYSNEEAALEALKNAPPGLSFSRLARNHHEGISVL